MFQLIISQSMIIINGRSLSERGRARGLYVCLCQFIGELGVLLKKKEKKERKKTRFAFTPSDKEGFKKTNKKRNTLMLSINKLMALIRKQKYDVCFTKRLH